MPTRCHAPRPLLAPTLLATLISSLGGTLPSTAFACTQLNQCVLQGTLTPRIHIEASGAAGKDGRDRSVLNGEWGTHGESGKNVQLITASSTSIKGIGQLPPIPPFVPVRGAAVLHVSTSGGRGGNGGKSSMAADGVGGIGGRGGTISASLQGTYHNTSTLSNAGAIALYSRGGSSGTGYHNVHLNHAPAGKGGTISVNSQNGYLDVSTQGSNSVGMLLDASGGRGGDGRKLAAWVRARAGDGGAGGAITLNSGGSFRTSGAGSTGILALADGGNGGTVFGGTQFRDGAGGTGGQGGTISGSFGQGQARHLIETTGPGIDLSAKGGHGGQIEYVSGFNAPDGGAGGKGGTISFQVRNTQITTRDPKAPAIRADASGGPGFWGGESALGKGGSAGKGGDGGRVELTLTGTNIVTYGQQSHGAMAVADGGGGHTGGKGGVFSRAGDGSQGGQGGNTTLTHHGQIKTHGNNSIGLYVSSLGGTAGDGGRSSTIVAVGGHGGKASSGGQARLNNHGTVITYGEGSHALFAQTVGGGGGLFVAQPSQRFLIGSDSTAYSPSSLGGTLHVVNTGTAVTGGKSASGLIAQSIGGGGGAGGKAAGLIAVGGQGAAGGDGGLVDVTQRGRIDTLGEEAVGVLAHSIGGGGGYGGDAFAIAPGLTVGIGGRGGPGGQGGQVVLRHEGETLTAGRLATGLLAQSIGGGGGQGGSVTGIGTVSVANVTVGGSGGSGGSAGRVLLEDIAGTIRTSGAGADAIKAQSIGGGGGSGGNSTAVSLGFASVGVGGTGGTGGHGGAVQARSRATISTSGDGSSGMMMQSIGGGGGDGGSTVGATIGLPTNKVSFAAAIAVGGKGGGAGNAGSVAVSHEGNITTKGRESKGIIVQSIGGGGGKGGSASAVSLAVHPKGSFSASVALGGSGGGGGRGGTIHMDQKGSILTTGAHSDGIFAQSIGGGGGMGAAGSAYSIALGATSFGLAFALGGSGGDGGHGGSVQLQHSGSIHTQGVLSRGAVLQSIGGGGGDSTGADGGAFAGTVDASVMLGGSGGLGGNGGSITFVADKSSTIRTDGTEAVGLLAQSIGGGGGSAGVTGTAWSQSAQSEKPPPGADFTLKVQFALGGRGGSGGSGGQIKVDHAGQVQTFGSQSTALFAQSIGGGGGTAGAARHEAELELVVANLAIGGRGGSGGHGGTVRVDQTGSLLTHGDHSHGILAQSVGGGGGQGSLSSTRNAALVSVGGVFGGSGGTSSHGGSVVVNNAGSIKTRGRDSYGILAQSIGGGGGVADVNLIGEPELGAGSTLQLSIGGNGGDGGNGGNIQLTHQKGAVIETAGQNAHAIMAQSVGAGGGIGLQPKSNVYDLLEIQIGGKGGGGGSGGAINIDSQGDIVTLGSGAYGILAQSVGGGGGIGGDSSLRILDPAIKLPTSASGRTGKGGDITLKHSGRIHTFGANSAGILAQTIGGGGGIGPQGLGTAGGNKPNSQGGAIKINIAGEVRTHGENSPAIFAQSLGSGGPNGNIDITVADGGLVSGSHGEHGAGIVLDGGRTNSILIEKGGTVTSLGSHAIYSTPGTHVSTVNHGRIAGSIDVSGHAMNGFANLGRFDAGATVKLGNNAILLNRGILNPRGAGVIGETLLYSPMQQSSANPAGAGTLEVDANFRDRRSDVLKYSKNTELGGQVHTLARYPLPNRALTVVQAAGGAGSLKLLPELDSRSSWVYQYPLQQPDTRSLALSVEADFRANDPGLNEDQRNIAATLQDVWALEPYEDLYDAAVVFDQLVNVQTLDEYRQALDTLASDASLGPAAYIPVGNRSFFTRMMSCPGFYQDDTAMREGDCAWGRFLGNHIRRSATNETGGFTVSNLTYQIGGQKEVSPGWFLGGSLAYESSRHRLTDLPVRTDGDAFQAGVVLKRQLGPWLIAGSLTGGHGIYDTRRSIRLTDESFEAKSRWKARYASAGVRTSYVHAWPSWYLKPMLDVSLTYQHMPAYRETGAGPLNLHFDSASQWSSMVSPSIELGGRYEWRGNTLRPYVSAGVSWISDTGWDVKARFEGDPEQRPFGLTTDLPRHFGELKAGVVLRRKDNLELKAEYGARFADNYLSQTGELRLAIHY